MDALEDWTTQHVPHVMMKLLANCAKELEEPKPDATTKYSLSIASDAIFALVDPIPIAQAVPTPR